MCGSSVFGHSGVTKGLQRFKSQDGVLERYYTWNNSGSDHSPPDCQAYLAPLSVHGKYPLVFYSDHYVWTLSLTTRTFRDETYITLQQTCWSLIFLGLS